MKTDDKSKLLLMLIDEYINIVQKEVEKLSIFLRQKNLCDWRSNNIPIKGTFEDGLYRYSFHGSGCEITTPEYCFDFEFSVDCKIGGFDTWRLWTFLTDNNLGKKYQVLHDEVKLKELFNKLKEKKLIFQKDPNDVYFLKT